MVARRSRRRRASRLPSIAMLAALTAVPAIPGLAELTAQTPEVTSWSPREKAHPGQRLVITGRDFRTSGFRVTLTGPSGSVQIPIRSATASRIEAEITDETYTGPQGARLSVSHEGGGARVLEEGFRVLDRDAVLRGTSLWHVTASASSAIFSREEVGLRLHLFEFENGGTGTYSESVRLVRLVREWEVECEGGDLLDLTLDAGRRLARDPRRARGWESDWRTERVERQIEWRRLPDGRVELRKVGLQHPDGSTHDALARQDGRGLLLGYETLTAGAHVRPITHQPDCSGYLSAAVKEEAGIPPVRGVPFRLVRWQLERSDL